jgi:hypothetical protein
MYAPGYSDVVPSLVSSWTFGLGMVSEGVAGSTAGSGTYESANRGVWFPLLVPATCTVRRMWWANGATVNASNNIEAGIYSDDGLHKPSTKVITTGSVAQGTASQVQFADITDTILAPGVYWLYLSCSTTSATFFRSSVQSAIYAPLVKMEQGSIGPGSAPATATPAKASSSNIYLFGFATTASP